MLNSIKLEPSRSDNLRLQLKELMGIKSKLETIGVNEEIELDLSELKWVSPTMITPLVVILNSQRDKLEKIKLTIKYPFKDSVTNYLEKIKFPAGIEIKDITENKTLLPLVRIESIKESKINELSEIIQRNFPEHANALLLPIGELIDNVNQHAGSSCAFLMAQHYKQKNFMDICVVDNGMGIINSYKKSGIHFENDMEALNLAYQGISTKEEFGTRKRGFGISSSAKIATESCNGEFILISQNGGFHISKQGITKEQFSLGESIWNGTIAIARFKLDKPPKDIYSYVEGRCVV